MSTSETSSNTSSSATHFDDASSTWWDMGATVGVLAALASSSSSGRGVQDAPLRWEELTGRQWVACNLADSKKCYSNFRPHPSAFHLLHATLVAHHGLKSTHQCDSIEALGMFLWACGTIQCQRQLAERFGRSIDTVSRKFGEVLDVVVSFADTIVKPRYPTFSFVHPKLLRFSPYFDGCIGAIDGTHIPVSVHEHAHDDFINRKGFTSQNVLVVCDMDMRFIFVAAGKRGAAHDMAIFREAVSSSNSHFSHPPEGKYYLVDSGYPLREGYMAPYRQNSCTLPEAVLQRRQQLFGCKLYCAGSCCSRRSRLPVLLDTASAAATAAEKAHPNTALVHCGWMLPPSCFTCSLWMVVFSPAVVFIMSEVGRAFCSWWCSHRHQRLAGAVASACCPYCCSCGHWCLAAVVSSPGDYLDYSPVALSGWRSYRPCI